METENFCQVIEGVLEETVDRLGIIARRFKMHIIAPVWCIWNGSPRNAALILDREGNLTGVYCKVHPT